jgi:hypothetical protein
MQIYKAIILTFFVFGYEMLLLNLLGEVYEMFQDRVLRRIFGSNREKVENGENYKTRSLLYSAPNIQGIITARRRGKSTCSGNGADEKYIQNFSREL